MIDEMRPLFHTAVCAAAESPLQLAVLSNVRVPSRVLIYPSTKGGAIMQFLTHIIFLLNLLKTLINHFS